MTATASARFSRRCPAAPRPWTPSARAGPVPTTAMCARQCAFGADGVARLDQLEQPALRAQAAAPGRPRPDDVGGLAHRGDGAHDDLVEHLRRRSRGSGSRRARRAARGTPRSRPRTPPGLRSTPLPRRSGRCSSATAVRRPRLAAIALAASGSSSARASNTSASDTLRARNTSVAVRAVMRWFGSCTMTPPYTPRTTVMSPSASRMRSASRSDGRETRTVRRAPARADRLPSGSCPLTISARSSSAICCGFSRSGARRACWQPPQPSRVAGSKHLKVTHATPDIATRAAGNDVEVSSRPSRRLHAIEGRVHRVMPLLVHGPERAVRHRVRHVRLEVG